MAEPTNKVLNRFAMISPPRIGMFRYRRILTQLTHFRANNSCALIAGVLACLDGYMNIAMEQTEEYVHNQLKAKYGDCFIRGNNVTYISSARRI